MEKEIKGVKNFYVTAISMDGKLKMLYKMKRGSAEKSYGIFVAEMLKFPE